MAERTLFIITNGFFIYHSSGNEHVTVLYWSFPRQSTDIFLMCFCHICVCGACESMCVCVCVCVCIYCVICDIKCASLPASITQFWPMLSFPASSGGKAPGAPIPVLVSVCVLFMWSCRRGECEPRCTNLVLWLTHFCSSADRATHALSLSLIWSHSLIFSLSLSLFLSLHFVIEQHPLIWAEDTVTQWHSVSVPSVSG